MWGSCWKGEKELERWNYIPREELLLASRTAVVIDYEGGKNLTENRLQEGCALGCNCYIARWKTVSKFSLWTHWLL